MNTNNRVIVSSALGNVLEFYDFTICGVFISALSSVFFPQNVGNIAFLGGLFAFSAAFWTRPLGAVLFGYLGDKFGRKNILSITIVLMGMPTVIIGLLPGYSQIGIVAPILLVALRMIQGLCAGGEYNGAAIFSLEHSKERPGKISGLISGSCILGMIVGVVSGYFLSNYPPELGYWRYPFIFGGVVSIVGLYIRKNTQESPTFTKSLEKKEATTFKKVNREFALMVLTGAFSGVLSYTLFGFLTVYCQKYVGISLSQGIFASIFGMISFMISCILCGAASDYYPIKKYMYFPGFATLLLFPVIFYLFQMKSITFLIVGQIILGVIVGSFVGPSHAFFQTLFPVRNRYKGIAIGFSVGMAITGGSTAIVLALLLDKYKDLYIPAYYGAFWAVIWLIGLFLFNRYDAAKEAETMQPLKHLQAAF